MKTAILVGVVLIAALTIVAPTASAGPDCVQVYPWSELCEGDPGAVVCYYVDGTPEEVCEPIK